MANYLATDTDLTAVADAIRAKSGGSAQLAFPSGFVSAIGDIQTGGGGGPQIIASGTFTGNGNYDITVPVGKKMPQTDFIFKAWVDTGTEFPYDTNYKFADLVFVVLKGFAAYDLSSSGAKNPTGQTSVNVNNSETVTTVSLLPCFFSHQTVRNAGIGATASSTQPGSQKVVRDSTGFKIKLSQGNNSYKFPSGMIYNWEILYIGDSPAQDIVEVE